MRVALENVAERMLSLSPGATVIDVAAVAPLWVAPRATVFGTATPLPCTEKDALVSPAGTVTEAGILAAFGSLAVNTSSAPPAGAGWARYTVAVVVTPG